MITKPRIPETFFVAGIEAFRFTTTVPEPGTKTVGLKVRAGSQGQHGRRAGVPQCGNGAGAGERHRATRTGRVGVRRGRPSGFGGARNVGGSDEVRTVDGVIRRGEAGTVAACGRPRADDLASRGRARTADRPPVTGGCM